MNPPLGERLRLAREHCGLTKMEVAAIVLDPGEGKLARSATIAAWERETIGVSRSSLTRLAILYEERGGVSRAWFLGDGPMLKTTP